MCFGSGLLGQFGGRTYSSSRRDSSGYSVQARWVYQTHTCYFGKRHYWNDRSRW